MSTVIDTVDEISVPDWTNLPELILGNIFRYLTTPDRLRIGTVCSAWESAASRPEVWESFEFSEIDVEEFGNSLDSLRHELFFSNYDGNVTDALSEVYVSAIKMFGRSFRRVNVLYKERSCNNILYTLSDCCCNIVHLKIQRLKQNVQVVRNHDSSYKEVVHNILKRNTRLKELHVRGIDTYTVPQHKDPLPIGAVHSYALQKLSIVQSFRSSNLGNLMYLVNLRELALEPQLLSYSLLHHLAGKSLTDLHIVAISKHMEFYNEALQNWQWIEIKKQGTRLRVHCLFSLSHEWTEKEIILKKEMPVKCLKYAKYHLLKYPVLADLICNYSSTLVEFIDFSFLRKSYKIAQGNGSDRVEINARIFQIVASCALLRTLAVKEVLYSETVLSMLAIRKSLDILLQEDQLEYSEFISDHNQPLLYEEYDLIHRSWMNKDSFLSAVLQLTNKEWHFFTEGSERYYHFIRNDLKLL